MMADFSLKTRAKTGHKILSGNVFAVKEGAMTGFDAMTGLETASDTESWQNRDNHPSSGGKSHHKEPEAARHAISDERLYNRTTATRQNTAQHRDRQAHLARTIESEIIPRLLLAHLASRAGRSVHKTILQHAEIIVQSRPVPLVPERISEAQIAEFSDIVIRQPLKSALGYIDALLKEEVLVETIILELLAPTARHLGALWEQDHLSYVDVTLGLSRLQQVLRVYGPRLGADVPQDKPHHRILLAAMPGEQHTFGLSIVEEFFRRDGWDVTAEAKLSRLDLLARAREEWFDVVGLSASAECSIALLAPLIQSIRDVALNRDIRVIIGGSPFLAEPKNALALGADLVSCNGREAVLIVDRLLAPEKNT